jgi:type IV secretion system protein VirB5
MAATKEISGVSQHYLDARAAWDERYGDLITRAKNWRIAFLCMTGVALLLGLSLLAEMRRSHVVPFVVAVDNLNQIVATGPATEASVADPRLIRAQLETYVEEARGISSDPLVTKQHLTDVFNRTVSGSASDNVLKQYYTTDSPFERDGATVQVEVHNIAALTATSYEITWSETKRDKLGNQAAKEEWKGVVGIVIAPPKDEVAARKNPLGIYVTTISWSRSV